MVGVPCIVYGNETYNQANMLASTDWDSVIEYLRGGGYPSVGSVLLSNDGSYITRMTVMPPVTATWYIDEDGLIKFSGNYYISIDQQKARVLYIEITELGYGGDDSMEANVPGHNFFTNCMNYNFNSYTGQ